ncbi:MAG: prepilin-type N-terminal cleavage/methylation domain-containing protein [Phormidesmis sp.]
MSLAIKHKKKDSYGFTLIELLVSIIVASIVTSGLLYLVNQVVRIDQREASLENVQRDMQRAMDYITDDLRESVYVYSDPTTITSQLTPGNLPTGTGGTLATPIVAFWRPEFLSADESNTLDGADCSTLTAPLDDDCDALKLRQSYYSLVVYFTLGNTSTDNNSNWDGQARIIRYTLPQYKKSAIGTTFQQTGGYTAPNNDFSNWAPDPAAATDGDWAVLVDYVDSPVSNVLATDCSAFDANYNLAPSTASTLRSNSFMVCVSAPGTLALGSNQEVALMLRGSAQKASQAFSTSAPTGSSAPSQSVLPSLESRVLVRGAANKNPNSN